MALRSRRDIAGHFEKGHGIHQTLSQLLYNKSQKTKQKSVFLKAKSIARLFFRNCQIRLGFNFSYCQIDLSMSVFFSY